MEQLLYKVNKRPEGRLSMAPRGTELVWVYVCLYLRRAGRAMPLSYRAIADETGLARTVVRDALIWLTANDWIKPL